jgi:hypothetical protein
VHGEERVEELARMLSGSTGEVSLAHARELMDESDRRDPSTPENGSAATTSRATERRPAITGRRG